MFFEYKNLIINIIKNIYNEKKEKKKKVTIGKEIVNNSIKTYNSEKTKSIGIKGIIKLVDKKGK